MSRVAGSDIDLVDWSLLDLDFLFKLYLREKVSVLDYKKIENAIELYWIRNHGGRVFRILTLSLCVK